MWSYDLAVELMKKYNLPQSVSLSNIIKFIDEEEKFEYERLKNNGIKRPNNNSIRDTVSVRINVWLGDKVWVIEDITNTLITYRVPYIFFRTIPRSEVV